MRKIKPELEELINLYFKKDAKPVILIDEFVSTTLSIFAEANLKLGTTDIRKEAQNLFSYVDEDDEKDITLNELWKGFLLEGEEIKSKHGN